MFGPVPARQSKRRNVARWVSAAKALGAPVLAWLDTRVADKGLEHRIPMGFFLDNPYFVGCTGQAMMQLPVTGQLAVLQQVAGAIDDGIKVSKEEFQTRFCAPVKLALAWVNRHVKHFPSFVADNEAVSHVCFCQAVVSVAITLVKQWCLSARCLTSRRRLRQCYLCALAKQWGARCPNNHQLLVLTWGAPPSV